MMKRLQRNMFSIVALMSMASMAEAVTWYVATTGNDSNPGTQAAPFLTIQKGLSAAGYGDTVLVAAGTYIGAGNKYLSFGGKSLSLVSQSGAAATIIDCQGQLGRARGFTFINGETNAAVLDGFTIQNGAAEFSTGAAGAGISIQAASPTIRNCVIKNCTAFGSSFVARAGGVYILNGSPRFENCTFTDNRVEGSGNDVGGGGLGIDGASNPTFIKCAFTGNQVKSNSVEGVGGAVAAFGSGSLTLIHCTLIANRVEGNNAAAWGGGIYTSSTNSLTLTGCTLTQNQAYGKHGTAFGGGLAQEGSATVTNCGFFGNLAESESFVSKGGGAYLLGGMSVFKNCLFVGNQTEQDINTEVRGGGGGIFAKGETVLTNCTLAHNSARAANRVAETVGGGIWVEEFAATVTNCIFHANYAEDTLRKELFRFASAPFHISYCIVQGGVPFDIPDASHILNVNPLFVRTPFTNGANDYGDLHLQANSPCINAGTGGAPNLPTYDLQGFLRIVGSAPDMGVYEFGSTTYFAVDLYVDKAAGSDTTGNGTPGSPFQTVTKALSMADPIGLTILHIKAGNYGSDRPVITGKVIIVNWGNMGEASIGKP
jgi:hypothetical protein